MHLMDMQGKKLPILVGTSGYTYAWNKGKQNKFKWYIDQGFNSVEINGRFYRFPTESWVANWKNNSKKNFVFSVKVHRSITHYTRLGEKSIKLWKRFKQPLESIDDRISFWLFQMPSSFKYNDENMDKIKNFEDEAKLGNKAVIEFRDPSWWKKSAINEITHVGIAFCSVDAPHLPSKLISVNQTTYVRLHGTTQWYNYLYSEKELSRFVSKLKKAASKKKAIYLNNDHGMLPNGIYLLKNL